MTISTRLAWKDVSFTANLVTHLASEVSEGSVELLMEVLTLLSPSYFEVYQAQAHCAPLQNIYMFRPIAMKFGTDVKQVIILKTVPSKLLKVTMWGRISTKCDKILGNMLEKIWHALQESNI